MTAHEELSGRQSAAGDGGVSISVVIPTSGRATLTRAIDSVLSQTVGADVTVLVIADGPEALARIDAQSIDHSRVRVLSNSARSGAARSRNCGIEAATGDYVAFLDDDDEWLPGKLASQLATAERMRRGGAAETIVSCLSVQRGVGSPADSSPVPARTNTPDERIEDYLFLKRGPSVGRPSLFTSTLLVPRELAVSIPWDESLERHQDWDWVLRLSGAGASIAFAEQIGTRIWVNSESSISASSNWRSSLAWVNARGTQWNRGTQVDFLTGQPLRYALQGRDLRGVWQVSRAIATRRRLPHATTLALGAAGALGRRPLGALLRLSGALGRAPGKQTNA